MHTRRGQQHQSVQAATKECTYQSLQRADFFPHAVLGQVSIKLDSEWSGEFFHASITSSRGRGAGGGGGTVRNAKHDTIKVVLDGGDHN